MTTKKGLVENEAQTQTNEQSFAINSPNNNTSTFFIVKNSLANSPQAS